MFAKLKKKIEEEVGDLGQLTSPLANPFVSGDRRVGGSTQGTNTPNNLGSRQSSLASLVDIHTHDEPTSPSPLTNISLPVPLTPTPVPPRAANSLRSKENVEAEVKKVNAEWQKKYDSMRKSFEERLQNQEADFAWKYGSKEEELERLRSEKRKAEELIKTMEGSYQNKMTRVQDDMDQLEGFTKQEMAKLLNTQADLQKAQSDVIEQANLAKELAEENKQLKAENETILRNLDRDRLNRVKFEAEHADITNQISTQQQEIQQKDQALADTRSSLEDSVNFANDLVQENNKLKSENAMILQDLEKERRNHENFIVEHSITAPQVNNLKFEIQEKEKLLADLHFSLENSEKLTEGLKQENNKIKDEFEKVSAKLNEANSQLENFGVHQVDSVREIQNLRNDLQLRESSLSELKASLEESTKSTKAMAEDNQKLKDGNEAILQKLDSEVRNRETFESQRNDLSSKISRLQGEVQERDLTLAEMRSSLEDSVKYANDLSLENARLKTSNETIQQNLEKQKQEHEKFIVENSSSTPEISLLQLQIQERENLLSEIRSSLEDSNKLSERLKEENRKIKDDLDVVSQKLNQANSQAEKIGVEHSASIKEIENLRHDLLQSQNSVSELKTFVEESTKSREETAEENKKLKDKHESILQKLDTEVKKQEAFQLDRVSLNSQISQLQAELQKRESVLSKNSSSMEDALRQVESNYEKLQVEHEDSVRKIQNFQLELQNRNAALSDLKSSLEKSIASNEEVVIDNKKLIAENASICKRLEEEKCARASAERESNKLSSQISQLQKKISDRETDISGMRTSMEVSLKQLGDTREELKKVNGECESIRRRYKDLESRKQEALNRIQDLETELVESRTIIEPAKTKPNGFGADDDVESFKERIRELEAKLNDKNKALKLRQQQLQDMRKTLAKEMKGNSASTLLLPADPAPEYFSKSSSQNSLASSVNDFKVEESSQAQVDTEPAVIPSSNSHLETTYSYANDVNFQYMKSVIFKFVTSHDPQVTHHLTKVVATLLHLTDEETRILERCSDKGLMTWLGSRESQGF